MIKPTDRDGKLKLLFIEYLSKHPWEEEENAPSASGSRGEL